MVKLLRQTYRFFIHSDRGNIILIIGVALAILLSWCCFLDNLYKISDDTLTYFYAGKVFANGEIDYLRTPIYPLICITFEYLFDSAVLEALSILNIIVFLVSIIYLYRTISLFTQRRTIKFITTVLYAWNIPGMVMCLNITPDSPSISFVIIFGYLITRMITGTSSRNTIWCVSIILIFLILLRPYNICLIPVLLIAVYISHLKGKLNFRATILSLGLSGALLCGYCLWFMNTYGFFGLSYVSSNNIFCIMNPSFTEQMHYTAGCVFPKVGKDKAILWFWLDRDYCKSQLEEIIYNNPKVLIDSKLSYLLTSSYHRFPFSATIISRLYADPFQSVDLGTIYSLLSALFLVEIYFWRKNKATKYVVPIMLHLLTCAICIITAIAGSANFDAHRLVMPIFPSLCLLAGLFTAQLNIRIPRDASVQQSRFFIE